MNKTQRAETTRKMELTFWHCPECERVFLGANTLPAFDFGDVGIWARVCPADSTRVSRLKDDDVDLSIVDYLGVTL
jgi:hypothetical protein